MKRIFFVTRSLSAGGAERVIVQLANSFTKENIECTIITLNNDKAFYDINNQINQYPIGKLSTNRIIDKIKKYKTIREYVKLNKPDIVLSLPEDVGIYVIPSLIGTGIPVVVSERNNPWVMPWKKVTRLFRKIFYPFAKGIIFQTEEAASFFSKKIQKKGIVLPNPLDLGRIPEPISSPKRKEIVGAGRLESQKNFPLLIKSFANFYKKYPDYSLTIYGEGTLKDELKSLAASLLPAKAYSFKGNSQDLLNEINGASMFVLSSDYEGMPNVLIEAMALGLPVISTNCPSGGPAKLIQNGINGILTRVGDEKELSAAMVRLIEDNKLRNKISKNALKIRDILDSDRVSKQWREYLEYCARK